MTVRIDPEKNEIRMLKENVIWRGKKVIEIGSGNGRLTLRLAKFGVASISALDPSGDMIREARKNLPERFKKQIQYAVGSAEKLKYPSDTFDIAVFSWVL